MQTEFLFAGFGGQGVMFAGQTLAHAAMIEGLEVTWIPSYGPEMRGGTAHCFVVISNRPIGSPIVRSPTVAVLFNNPSFTRYEPVVACGGALAYNSTLVTITPSRHDVTVIAVPATRIADDLGSARLSNIVLLGAVLKSRPVVSLDSVRTALERFIPEHHRDKLPANMKALDAGAELIASPKVQQRTSLNADS